MSRPTALSGFPEWLPSQRIVEQRVLEIVTRTFELHGFASLHSRAVEPLSQLLRKGETSKEVYVLSRLQESDTNADGAQRESKRESDQLGLHFDLTVPFARYVLENAGQLTFPFKRYQIQPVWRGERPQDGRFREFWQADIDVVGAGELPEHFEVEIPLIAAEALTALGDLGLPPVRILVNNRKVPQGFYTGLGLGPVDDVLRIVDKLAKIGPDGVGAALRSELGANDAQVEACLALAGIAGTDSVGEQVRELAARFNVVDETLNEGLAALDRLLEQASRRAPGVVVADLSVARGLDYYTGAVYETVLVGHEELGSICSGGRYDALASDGKRSYPGVGISIGISRVLSRLFAAGLTESTRSVPTAVLAAGSDEGSRPPSDEAAPALPPRRIPTDVAPTAAKFGKQIRYAERRGIPFVWFPETGEVKDIRSGEQSAADSGVWEPSAADWWPRAVATNG